MKPAFLSSRSAKPEGIRGFITRFEAPYSGQEAWLPLDRRPKSPAFERDRLELQTLDRGGDYPDTMPQAIRGTDALGLSCLYLPTTRGGKFVDTDARLFEEDKPREQNASQHGGLAERAHPGARVFKLQRHRPRRLGILAGAAGIPATML